MIYHEDDVILPRNDSTGCGLSNATRTWMESVQRSRRQTSPDEADNEGHSLCYTHLPELDAKFQILHIIYEEKLIIEVT